MHPTCILNSKNSQKLQNVDQSQEVDFKGNFAREGIPILDSIFVELFKAPGVP